MLFKKPIIEAQTAHSALSSILKPQDIDSLYVDDKNNIQIVILWSERTGHHPEALRQQVEQRLLQMKHVGRVQVMISAKKDPIPDPHGMNKNPKLTLPIKKIIAVASGKGGVGKSTISTQLAAACAQAGMATGLLDADIYGPNIPHLTNLPYKKPATDEHGKLIPFAAPGIDGLKVMSIGFMVDQDTPMIWRGPMVQSAIYQMLRDVVWGTEEDPLDMLIVDMPPGTGDAQLTMAQKIDLYGAIIVSTPQDLSLLDATKAIEMFKKTNVPVLGLVENMSMYICPNCGHQDHIFGHGTVKEAAEAKNIPFIGHIPLSTAIQNKAYSVDQTEFDCLRSFIKNL